MSITLRPHQIDGVNFALSNFLINKNKAFLLADETGLGKTYTALFTINQLLDIWPDKKVLIVCPLSVIDYWEQCLNTVRPGFSNYKILNYQRLKRLFLVKKELKNKRVVTNYTLVDKYDYVIFDEAHLMKGYSSVSLKLGSKIMDAAEHFLLLTATPAQSPLDVAYLKDILHFDDFFSWLYHGKFAIDKHPILGHLVWAHNEQDLNRIFQSIYPKGLGLRRRAKDLAGWPEQQIEPWGIPMTSAQKVSYDKAFEQYLSRIQKEGIDPSSYSKYLDLIEVGVLRQETSLLKVSFTAQLAKDLIADGKQVAIYSEYLSTIAELQKAIGDEHCLVLTGDTPAELRNKIVEDFANGIKPIILFTIYQSINLQQPTLEHPERIQLNHDVPWSGIKATQLNGRCHRDGKHAIIYNMYMQQTIDAIAVKKMTERCRAVSKLAGDITENDFAKEVLTSTL